MAHATRPALPVESHIAVALIVGTFAAIVADPKLSQPKRCASRCSP
jgi:hypothetical protein